MDDFQTPYGGIPEVSSALFGDSWKLQSYCSQPTEIRVSYFYQTKFDVKINKKIPNITFIKN